MINLLKIKKAGGERPSCGKRAFPPLICFCLYGYRLFLLPCFQVRTLRTFRTFPPLIKVLAGLRQVGLSPTAAYSPEDKVRTLLRTFRTFPPLIKVLVGLRQVGQVCHQPQRTHLRIRCVRYELFELFHL